jgi:DeoR C terminal sensor domain
VRGAAISLLLRAEEPPFSVRAVAAGDAKRRIGRVAADLLAEGESVALDSGTTALEIARCLTGKRVTVMPLSLHADTARYWTQVLGHAPGAARLRRIAELDTIMWSRPNQDSLDAAASAAERGVKLALLSNAPARLAGQLDRLPWLAAFCPRILSGNVGMIKPEPGIYAFAPEGTARRRKKSPSSMTAWRTFSRPAPQACEPRCSPVPASCHDAAAGSPPSSRRRHRSEPGRDRPGSELVSPAGRVRSDPGTDRVLRLHRPREPRDGSPPSLPRDRSTG